MIFFYSLMNSLVREYGHMQVQVIETQETFNFCKMMASIFDELTYREFSEIFDRGLEDTI